MLILRLQANARDGIHGNKALKNIEPNVSYRERNMKTKPNKVWMNYRFTLLYVLPLNF